MGESTTCVVPSGTTDSAHLSGSETHRARVTHPFHPLHGQVFEVVDRRRSGDGERLYLEVTPGQVVSVPGSWTSLGPADPWLEVFPSRPTVRTRGSQYGLKSRYQRLRQRGMLTAGEVLRQAGITR